MLFTNSQVYLLHIRHFSYAKHIKMSRLDEMGTQHMVHGNKQSWIPHVTRVYVNTLLTHVKVRIECFGLCFSLDNILADFVMSAISSWSDQTLPNCTIVFLHQYSLMELHDTIPPSSASKMTGSSLSIRCIAAAWCNVCHIFISFAVHHQSAYHCIYTLGLLSLLYSR